MEHSGNSTPLLGTGLRHAFTNIYCPFPELSVLHIYHDLNLTEMICVHQRNLNLWQHPGAYSYPVELIVHAYTAIPTFDERSSEEVNTL